MKKERPLVSVVIPTYNRYKYLHDCVETVRSVKSDEIEIVIQDNSTDNTEFKEYIKSIGDERVKYFYTPEHISVVDNCDMGIFNSSGYYVCMIGDDDTICSNIVKAAQYLKDNNIEGCCFPFPGFYWPDMNSTYRGKKVANFFIKYKATGEVCPIDTPKEVKEKACKGGLSDRMPRVYHALVSKNCLDRIYAKTGTYFPGPSPDMANGVAVCLEAESSVWLNDYLIVSGYGTASSRGQSNRNEHFGKIEDMPWLPKNTRENWDKNNPPYFSGETIFAQSAIQALKAMGADEKDYRFDYSGLYASFFWQHKETRGLLLKFVICSPKRTVWFVKGVIKKLTDRFKRRGIIEKNYMQKNNIKTLIEAKTLTEDLSCRIEYTMIK